MTIELSNDDVLELRLLLAALKLEIEVADAKSRNLIRKDPRNGMDTKIDRVSDRERELRRGIEALERVVGR